MDRTLVNFTATVEQVFATRQEREHKDWSDHKKELVPAGYIDTGWLVRLKEPSLKSCFPLADFSVTFFRRKGETPDIYAGNRYSMEVALKGPYRTLVSWSELHEEDEPDVIDEALASVGMGRGERGLKPCPPPPPPVQPDQAQMDLLRMKLNDRKAHRRIGA